jgi:hypothetical protein
MTVVVRLMSEVQQRLVNCVVLRALTTRTIHPTYRTVTTLFAQEKQKNDPFVVTVLAPYNRPYYYRAVPVQFITYYTRLLQFQSQKYSFIFLQSKRIL